MVSECGKDTGTWAAASHSATSTSAHGSAPLQSTGLGLAFYCTIAPHLLLYVLVVDPFYQYWSFIVSRTRSTLSAMSCGFTLSSVSLSELLHLRIKDSSFCSLITTFHCFRYLVRHFFCAPALTDIHRVYIQSLAWLVPPRIYPWVNWRLGFGMLCARRIHLHFPNLSSA